MEKTTIHRLVADKNEELERAALRSAESIIGQIATQQEVIQKAQDRIAELRKELTDLEVQKLDAKQILGE